MVNDSIVLKYFGKLDNGFEILYKDAKDLIEHSLEKTAHLIEVDSSEIMYARWPVKR